MTTTLYFDGLCEPVNPGGLACYGWLITGDGGETLDTGKGVITRGKGATNNIAEYQALLAGLRAVKEMDLSGPIKVKGDSQLVIKQMTGVWQCRAANLRPLLSEAKQLSAGLGDVRFRWIPRDLNTRADKLSWDAYREATNTGPPG